MIRRFGRKEGLYSLVVPALTYGLVSFAIGYSMWPYFYYLKNETFIVLGVFALWRYGWQSTHYFRSWFYAMHYYPRLKRRVADLPDAAKFPEHIFFVIPSYKEEPWVSVEALQSVLSNLADIPSRATLIIATGDDRDDSVLSAVWQAHPVREKVDMVLQRQAEGKRIAMGHALRALARRYRDEPNSVTVFMDGDSYLEPETLRRTVPFFSAYSDLGALTTNEIAYINSRSRLYKDWFNLKFGQRHVLFQSHSLSNKVLTLTGRFSILRTSILVSEDFIRQIESDVLTHWMHGRFRFLMGDDKSSWFYLMKHGWKMLYIPDVTVYSLESRDAGFVSVSMSLPYRWYGNTMRNNARALALGPRRTGLFIWLAILDQRLSMWTSLVGIVGALILSVAKSFFYLPFYIAWVLAVRVAQITMIAVRGHPVSLLTIPLMLYNQWAGAIVKIRASFHLADQRWTKGKTSQSGDVNRVPIPHILARYLPTYSMVMAYGVFLVALLLTENALSLPDLDLLKGRDGRSDRVIDAEVYGVRPDDGMDDGLALQTLIERLPPEGRVTVRLPAGRLDLSHPLTLRRGHLVLAGAGVDKTLLVSHLALPATAAITVAGGQGERLGKLAVELPAAATRLAFAGPAAPDDYLLIKQGNDAALFDGIGSKTWRRPYPALRQSIVRVAGREAGGIVLDAPTGVDFGAGLAEVWRIAPVRDTTLRDFTLEQRIEGADPASVRHVYENRHPDHALDLIALHWTARARIENVRLLNAGRHPLDIENSHGFEIRDFAIDGAWNKGEGGHGYLRIARAHHGLIERGRIENIRHIAVQWSASYNRLRDLDSGVDLNFHGGQSHHNQAEDIRFRIPPEHPWPPVYRTPADAHWAPPDGPGNDVRASP